MRRNLRNLRGFFLGGGGGGGDAVEPEGTGGGSFIVDGGGGVNGTLAAGISLEADAVPGVITFLGGGGVIGAVLLLELGRTGGFGSCIEALAFALGGLISVKPLYTEIFSILIVNDQIDRETYRLGTDKEAGAIVLDWGEHSSSSQRQSCTQHDALR